MSITKKDVEYVAHLSRLMISESEIEEYTKQLAKILEHVNRLQKVNTDNVEPMSYAIDIKNVFREDINEKSIDRKKVLDAAPVVEKNCFKVPKII